MGAVTSVGEGLGIFVASVGLFMGTHFMPVFGRRKARKFGHCGRFGFIPDLIALKHAQTMPHSNNAICESALLKLARNLEARFLAGMSIG